MAVSQGACMCLLSVKLWVGDLVLSDVCEASCLCLRARACVRVLVGPVNLTLNPILIYTLTLTTTDFQPQSKVELQDALQKCSI